ncbi:MAG: ABC transporter permease [Ignisphaera sp.]
MPVWNMLRSYIDKHLTLYIISRLLLYTITIIASFTIIFICLRLMPVNIVEVLLAAYRSKGQYIHPQALIELREKLLELFGLKGSPLEQYFSFLKRFITLDFGPSLLAFPTPVKELVISRLFWTIGLLGITTIGAWLLGNICGVVATSIKNVASKVLQSIAVILYPIPYYIFALILIYAFCYIVPLFPLVGGITVVSPTFTLHTLIALIRSSILPALSIIIVSAFGWWFLSSRALSFNIMKDDFYNYAVIRGLKPSHILKRYVMKNVLLPQVTALGLALGNIFCGALLVEVIFAYPGLGYLLYRAILSGDYSTALGILSLSIIGVATATLILDLIYPLLDPRIRHR